MVQVPRPQQYPINITAEEATAGFKLGQVIEHYPGYPDEIDAVIYRIDECHRLVKERDIHGTIVYRPQKHGILANSPTARAKWLPIPEYNHEPQPSEPNQVTEQIAQWLRDHPPNRIIARPAPPG